MRSDVAADLEHDLRVRCQPNPTEVAGTLAAVHERPHRRGGAERSRRRCPSACPQTRKMSPTVALRVRPDDARRRGRVHGYTQPAGRTSAPTRRNGNATPIPAGIAITRLFAKSSRWTLKSVPP